MSFNNFSCKIVETIAELLEKVDHINLHNSIKENGALNGRNLNEEECEFLVKQLNKLKNNVRFQWENYWSKVSVEF